MLRRCLCSLLIPAALLLAADADAGNCTAVFRLDDAVSVGALQYEVTYPAWVDFDGSGTGVSCSDPTGSFTTFTDDDTGLLTAAYVSFFGFNGPTDVAVCDVTADPGTMPEDFVITVTDASDALANPHVPLPEVSLISWSCTGSSTTSTTMWGTTTSTTTSTTLPGPRSCLVDIVLADAVSVGSLQFDVDYSTAGGEFEGLGSSVTCSGEIQYALSSFNDDDAGLSLAAAIIKLGAFSGPTLLTSCVFLPGPSDPLPTDFVITVTDAADGAANPIVPLPAVVIGALDCFDPTATTTTTSTTSTTSTTVPVCGDGFVQAGEACDDGAGNSDTQPDACRLDCTPAACGDNVVDAGEDCDDGVANSDADPGTCRNDCANELTCGDADDNGVHTVTDASIVLQAAVGLRAGCEPGRCDTNGDGTLTVGDAQVLLLNVVGLPVPLSCMRTVTIRVTEAVTIGTLGFEVDYSALDTSFLGEGAAVSCTSALGGASVTFDNASADGKLGVSIVDGAGFAGPTDIASCMLREHAIYAGPADLVVTVTEATDPGAQPVAPLPSVSAGF